MGLVHMRFMPWTRAARAEDRYLVGPLWPPSPHVALEAHPQKQPAVEAQSGSVSVSSRSVFHPRSQAPAYLGA